MAKKNKLVGRYTITIEETPDDKILVSRVCEKLEAMELLGHLLFAQDEIMKQIRGEIKPDIVKRIVKS